MATSSPTTADIKATLSERMTAILKAGLTRAEYAEYSRLEEMLGIIARAEDVFREQPVFVPVQPPIPTPAEPAAVKTYNGTPTARERVRAYPRKHGPSRVADIIRDTGVPAGTAGGLLNAASTEFVKVKHGVWKLREAK